MFDLLKEIIRYFKERKKFWLIPVMIVLGIFGGLIVLTAGTAIAPFIYTIFKMLILGISVYHDSAVALIKDGEIIVAAQEERFSRIKHDASFPNLALNEILKFQKLSFHDIIVVFYDKPS